MVRLFSAMAILLVWASTPFAATSLPTADLPGAQDSPLLGRYEGSVIVSYEHEDFDEFTMPLSALERVDGRMDSHNNIYFEPKQKKTMEGEHWRLVYLMPEGVSPLEVARNYQEEMESTGGEIVYECKEMDCGGDPSRFQQGRYPTRIRAHAGADRQALT